MFTGIIEQTGTIVSLKDTGGVRRLTVEAPGLAGRLREGDSLGVSGVCLTALDVDPKLFHADLAQETLDKTSLGALAAGAKVNLELPTAAGSPLGGHIVQGHVDGWLPEARSEATSFRDTSTAAEPLPLLSR
jgi:riboflavin synthase